MTLRLIRSPRVLEGVVISEAPMSVVTAQSRECGMGLIPLKAPENMGQTSAVSLGMWRLLRAAPTPGEL